MLLAQSLNSFAAALRALPRRSWTWSVAVALCACGSDPQATLALTHPDAGLTRASAGAGVVAGASAGVAGMRAAAGGGAAPVRDPASSSGSPTHASGADASAEVDVDAEMPVHADAAVAADHDAGASIAKPPCLKKGSQVVLLGDSYINWVSHNFPSDLNAVSGQTFRMYAVGAYSMGSGGIGLIPPQLDEAVKADPDITTVVLDGGGDVVLVPDVMQFPMGADCRKSAMSATIPDCQAIVKKALAAASMMLDNAVAQGVKDVIYFYYPRVPEGTLIGGAHPNAILEYALPMARDFCETTLARSHGKLNCHFIDMIPVFDGHPDYFAPTDIHPSPAGSAAMAKAVWNTMKDACVAQPASSGCCTP
jgi:hypothetical protein